MRPEYVDGLVADCDKVALDIEAAAKSRFANWHETTDGARSSAILPP
jgi:hypothetical protein